MGATCYAGDEVKVLNPRPYQLELLQYCRNYNAILVLGTGSGKTLISIMLMKELGDVINGRLAKGAKRTIFIANTVPLVEQQAEAIQDQSNFKVGKLTGKSGFESWKEERNINKSDILPQKIVFHPWKEQLIADKSIADCVEALIGVYFLIGGIKAAYHLLIWLGFEDLLKNHDPPTTAIINCDTAQKDLHIFYRERSFNELEKTLDYSFKDKSFLLEAVTHPSDGQNKITGCYQRLEYLGDAVLDFLITKFVYSKFQDYDPGQLTDLRSHYVNNATLGRLTVDLGLHKYLLHNSMSLNKCIASFVDLIHQGNNEFNTENDSAEVENVEVPKALGDMFEAIIGAIYIDSDQSLEVCWKVLKIILKDEFIKTESSTPINDVRVFYETAAKIGCTPSFEYLLAFDGIYECKIRLNDYGSVSGKGKNKRVAKHAAAKQAVTLLSKRNVAE